MVKRKNGVKTHLVKPKRLKSGDTIGIVAPASSFDVDNFKQGISKLRKMGYKVKYERTIFNKCWSQPGHNKQRGLQINRMFADKEVKAIFCAKAGYGSVEIIPFLNKNIIRDNPKIFVGYSDITVLLLYLQRVGNMVVFHGPVVADEIYTGMHVKTSSYLLRMISNPSRPRVFKFPQVISFKGGRSQGILVGGNMSLIVEAIGTSYEIDTANKILFLEDISEDISIIRGYLTRMKQAGKFKTVKGLVFGKMVNCFDKIQDLRRVVEDLFAEQDIPIIAGFPSGHRARKGELRVTLPLGVAVTLNADASTLKISEGGVL